MLSHIESGGTWSSSNTLVATVDIITGEVTAVSPGSATITYSAGFGSESTVVTVNPLPAAITGNAPVCTGSQVTLASATAGGQWSTSSVLIAAVGSASGIVTGGTAGMATITYMLPTGCYRTAAVTVNAVPAPTTGSAAICIGAASTLSNATTGGTWSSSNTSVANVGSSTGIVSGLTTGTSNISYIIPSGCYRVTAVTVNAMPAAIGGTLTACPGTTTTLSNASGGGTWSSGNTAVATIGTTTGIVTGVTSGVASITYTASTTCMAFAEVTINALPAVLTGTTPICSGATTTWSSATTGGTWTSSNTAIAAIGATTGIITGGAAGAAVITYTLPTGCRRTAGITVNPIPAAITGTLAVCEESTVTLSNASGAGTWSSSSTANATIGSATGFVSGVNQGTTTITYTIPTGCYRTATLTVNPLPADILGTGTVCVGSTTTLTNPTPGGTWISALTFIATAGSASGIITGVAAGTTTISYRLFSGCASTTVVTVDAMPPASTGTLAVCAGATTTLSNTAAGGTWSTTSPSASVDAGGVVSGLIAGTASITYALSTGCYRTTVVTVNALPPAIGGSLTVCAGANTTLTNTSVGGTWASSSSIAPIGGSNGVLAGLSAGTSNITYTATTGCRAFAVATVNALPAAITGTARVCIGEVTTLTSATSGGIWTSSNATIATIGTSSGLVTGIGAGTANITYTAATGCRITAQVTVNALPLPIGGPSVVCQGLTANLTNGTAGGTWVSGNTAIATITSGTGIVTGVTAGSAAITYTITSTGCRRTANVTVNPAPPAITGPGTVCVGSSITLANDSVGGTWVSSSPTTLAVNISTGIASGLTTGTATVTYTITTGCKRFAVISVNALPAVITGPTRVCHGLEITLANVTTGGTWSSSVPTIAPVGPTTGVVTGSTPGVTTIIYTLPTGCSRSYNVTVNALPATITGTTVVCAGATTTLSSATAGGSWSSSNTFAFAAGSGVIAGIAEGTAVITYTLPTGCIATTTVTINAVPNAITGTASLCAGTTTTLASTTGGGSWMSSNTSVATIGATGIVNGITAGTSTISYSLATGCKRTIIVSVNPIPVAISGTLTVCVGATTTLHNGTPTGLWSSGNTAVAIIGTGTGVVTGVAPGTSNITYTTAAGCTTTTAVTVNVAPSAITGTFVLCTGGSVTLSDSVAGGTWTSSSSVAAVDPMGGVVIGTGAGTAIISYSLLNGCRKVQIVTVNPLPSIITGLNFVCVGSITTLSSATTGGTWSSSAPAIASSTLITGYISGESAGTATITYTLSTGCRTTKTVTVNPLPASIIGTGILCAGATTTLSDATPGGTWSSSNAAISVVGSTGIVTGVGGGTAIISYRLPTGCGTTKTVTVNPLPSSIGGPVSVCVGASIFLSNAVAGGTWNSSNSSVATIDGSGNVTGIAVGTTVITYSLTTSCYTVRTIAVNPLPGAVVGATTICAGSSSTLTNTAAGGIWTTANAAVATVGVSSGILSGIAAGFTQVTYTLPTGCIASAMVSVNALPAPIDGGAIICADGTTTLSDISLGGTWSSSSTTVATIGSSNGVVSGVSAGTTEITYTLATGCKRTRTISVNPLPAAIDGTTTVCVGTTSILSTSPSGGAWTSNDPTIATASVSTGVITGISVGTVNVTYTLLTGCRITTVVTVNATPPAITGTGAICAGSTLTVANASAGGTWATGSTSVATIDPTTGVVTGMATGVTGVTYTMASGCRVISFVTVSLSPTAITGTARVCLGQTTTLGDFVGGGTWSSSNTAVATVGGTTGIVTGAGTGTVTVNYTVGSCSTAVVVTVNLAPGAITGTSNICQGSAVNLANSVAGGGWSTSNILIAPINTTGIVSGVALGTATITYTIGADCHATMLVTVSSAPPHAQITIHPADNVMCSNTLYQNFGTANGQPSGVVYTWSTTNATIFRQSADKQYTLISYEGPGTAVVRLSSTLTSSGCVLADSFIAFVSPTLSAVPEVNYYSDKLVCSDNTSDSYQWGYDDKISYDSTKIPFATFQDLFLPSPDFANKSYWVMTNHGGCKQKTYYNIPAGVTTTTGGAADIKVFPNPSDSRITIQVTGIANNDNLQARLSDVSGKVITTIELSNGKGTMDVSGLAPGTYMTTLYQDNMKIGTRIVIKN